MKTSWMIGLLMIWVVIVGVVVLIVFDQNDSLPSPEPLIVDEVDEVVEGDSLRHRVRGLGEVGKTAALRVV